MCSLEFPPPCHLAQHLLIELPQEGSPGSPQRTIYHCLMDVGLLVHPLLIDCDDRPLPGTKANSYEVSCSTVGDPRSNQRNNNCFNRVLISCRSSGFGLPTFEIFSQSTTIVSGHAFELRRCVGGDCSPFKSSVTRNGCGLLVSILFLDPIPRFTGRRSGTSINSRGINEGSPKRLFHSASFTGSSASAIVLYGPLTNTCRLGTPSIG